MKILVVAATHQEIAPFIKLNDNIETLICGVGIPSTVYHLTKKLLQQKYDWVIQAGIAGFFGNSKIKKGEVVLVEKDVFADIGVQEKGNLKTIFELGFGNENEYPFTKGWLINNSERLQNISLKKVKAATVNTLSDNKKQTKLIKKYFNAETESMEGAAFHFVCLHQNVSFLQLRGISNKVGERDKTKWKIKEAIENLNLELIQLIELLNK